MKPARAKAPLAVTLVGSLLVAGATAAACGGPTQDGAAPLASASASNAIASTAAPSASATSPNAPPATAPPKGAREGSSVAVTPEGDVALIADEDHDAIDVVPLPIGDAAPKVTKITAAGHPAQIVVLGRDVLVTFRSTENAAGALVIYRRGEGLGNVELTEAARVALPPDAWGIAVAPDGSTAAITSAWSAKVSLVDVSSRKILNTLDVAREPRGAVFDATGDNVYVSHLIGSDLTKITHARGEATVTKVALPASPVRAPSAEKLSASLGYALVVDTDRKRLYAPRQALGALGSFAWYGAPAVDALDVGRDTPRGTTRQLNELEAFLGQGSHTDLPRYADAASTTITAGNAAFEAPRAAVYRASQRSILIANEGGDDVVELDADMSDPSIGVMHSYPLATDREQTLGVALHGGAPSGIALSSDESIAYVYCRSTDELAAIPLANTEGRFDAVPPRFVKLADDASDADLVMGRRLFYLAEGSRMSGGAACASCHPEGRDDGHVWHEVHFTSKNGGAFTNLIATASAARHLDDYWSTEPNEGRADNVDKIGAGYPRRTPMLAGRVKFLGPYGWHADGDTLDARIIRGFQLHRWSGNDDGKPDAVERASAYRLAVFLRKGLVLPPTPTRDPTPLELRGREVFLRKDTACATCHPVATDYTNRDVVLIGQPPAQPGFITDPNEKFKVPSLLSLGGRAPYLHDGRFDTLDELVEKNADRMGHTTQLSTEDKQALVAFLKTL